MFDKTSESVSQVNAQLVSVRRVPTFQGASNSIKSRDYSHSGLSQGTANPIIESEDYTYGVNLDDGRGSDNGTISTSTLNLLDSPTNNLVRESYLRDKVRRVSSLESHEQPLNEASYPRDPESLTKKAKPFYRRTWFACLLYVLLLSMLAAAILALAVDRSITIPNEALKGELLQALALRERSASPDGNSWSLVAPDTGADASMVPKTDDDRPVILEFHPAVSTTQPEITSVDVTTLTPTSVTPSSVGLSTGTVPTEVPAMRDNWLFVLSLPGPLQGLLI